MSSTAQAFDTIELLECILLQLRPKEVLFFQRVNKHWQAVINASVRLQQALFFRTTDAAVSLWEARKTGVKVVKNTFLNPLINAIYEHNYTDAANVSDMIANSPRIHSSWNAPNASWRKMFPTQPAMTHIFDVKGPYWNHLWDHWSWKEKTMPKGRKRMGEIADELDKWVRFFEVNFETDYTCIKAIVAFGSDDEILVRENSSMVSEDDARDGGFDSAADGIYGGYVSEVTDVYEDDIDSEDLKFVQGESAKGDSDTGERYDVEEENYLAGDQDHSAVDEDCDVGEDTDLGELEEGSEDGLEEQSEEESEEDLEFAVEFKLVRIQEAAAQGYSGTDEEHDAVDED